MHASQPENPRAARLIAECAAAAAKHLAGDDSPGAILARALFQVGQLQRQIELLCTELAGYDSPSKLEQYSVTLDGVEFQVGAEFDADGDIVEVDYHIRGQDVSTLLSLKDSQAIDEQVIAQWQEAREDDAIASALEDYRERRVA